nr:Tex family protein [uncultured Solibaculum sp.]
MDILALLTVEFHLKPWQVEHAVSLIDQGNTIPFIARYRKEQTGSLDDQVLRELDQRLHYLRNLQKRKEEVSLSIEEAGAMDESLKAALDAAVTLAEVEDLYRPYRPRRRTRASIAREKGLEPLAKEIFLQSPHGQDPRVLASSYINAELGLETPEDALQGAMDIIAENLSDDASIRKRLRSLVMSQGILRSEAAKEEDSVYRLYYAFSEPIRRIPGYRVLAIDRGEREEYLKVSISLDRVQALKILFEQSVKEGSPCSPVVRAAAEDAYDRLIFPSVEREIRSDLTERADQSAIGVFSSNLRRILMQPPVKGKRVIGLDPAYRTGCKVAVVDETGHILDTAVIYPTPPHNKKEEAGAVLTELVQKYDATIFSIGNGTASRETELFVAHLLPQLPEGISYMVVSEAGASVYSASKLAAQELPQYDVSLRSAASIARRLQDPLAELVKIDPKSIGVGQYQHDMPQKALGEALDGVVESCVNTVGVDVNTASPSLLSHVAGLNATVAKNIVEFRKENGAFSSRTQLKKVPKLGPRTFEQCAGFLRIPESKEVLDRTAVHPESYKAAKGLLTLCGYSAEDVTSQKLSGLVSRVKELGERTVSEKIGVGIPTLWDIVSELMKPGRDPRDQLPPPLLRTDVMEMSDLKPGMELDGTVRNVVDFGAFVDIGVHQDGLVHISQMADRYIRHPSELLAAGDIVKVRVLSVDVEKKRISLTMKGEVG